MIKKTALVGFTLLVLLTSAVQAADETPVVAHVASIIFDVPGHGIDVTDEITIPAGLEFLRLGTGLTLTEVFSDNGGAGRAEWSGGRRWTFAHALAGPSGK